MHVTWMFQNINSQNTIALKHLYFTTNMHVLYVIVWWRCHELLHLVAKQCVGVMIRIW